MAIFQRQPLTWIRTMLMLTFAAFVFKLAATGRLGTLLAPTIRIIAVIGAILLIAVAIVAIIGLCNDYYKARAAAAIARSSHHPHEQAHAHGHLLSHHRDEVRVHDDLCCSPHASMHAHSHHHTVTRWSKWTLTMCVATLALAFSWSPRALGTQQLTSGGAVVPGQLDRAAWKLPTETIKSASPVADTTLARVATQFPGAPSRFLNHSFRLTGFVYHPSGMPSDYFIITRYFIYCCAADASPLGITVHSSDAWHYLNNTWITVTGTITSAPIPMVSKLAPTSWYQGHAKQPIMVATDVQLIKAPTEPYMYNS